VVINIADKKIGKVTHYYDKIGVAVIDLTQGLKVGDNIKFVHKDNEFTQAVDSLQIDHKSVKSVKKGDSLGLKVDQPVKTGAEVYKIS